MDNVKKRLSKGIVLTVLAFFVFYTVGFLYKQCLFPYVETKVDFWMEWCIRYAIMFGLGATTFILITIKLPAEKLSVPQKIGFGRFLKYLIVALGLANAGGIFGGLLISLATGTSVIDLPNYFGGGSALGAFLFLCFIPPMLEEVFFRKILIQKLNTYGNGVAILGSALAFSVYHTLLTSFQILHVFLIGLILAYIALKRNNILYVVIIHSIVNLYSVWQGRLAPLLPDPFSAIASSLVMLSIMISFVVILIKNRSKVRGFFKVLFQNQQIESVL